jgi:hypothetical protein
MQTILIILTLLLLALPSQAQEMVARMNMSMMGSGVAAAGLTCTDGSGDSKITSQEVVESYVAFGYTEWKAFSFSVGATTRVTSLTVKLRDIDALDNATVTLSIYTDSSGPSTEVSGTAVTLAETSISDDTQTDYKFSLSTPVTINTGTYWGVIRTDGADSSTTRLTIDVVASGGNYMDSTNSGGAWNVNDTRAVYFLLYGCQ